MQHFLNTSARDLSLARCKSLLQPFTPEPFPTLLIGTSPPHQVFQHANGIVADPDGATLRATLADAMGAPLTGTFELEGDEAQVVDAECTAAELAEALNAIPSVEDDGGVDVMGEWPSFLIAYLEAGETSGFTADATLLAPNATADLSVLTAGSAGVRELVKLTLRKTPLIQTTDFDEIASPYAGWEGRMPLTSAAALAWIQTNGVAVGDYIQGSTLLTIEAIDGDGNVTPLYQAAVTVRANNYDIETQSNIAASNPYFTAKPNVTGLASVGANAAKLGGIATLNTFNAGTTVRLFFTGDVVVDYRLVGSTASQSWPFLIRPYDYNASSNARQWALVEVNKAGQPCTYNNDSALFHFQLAGGLPTAVHLEVDQTGFALPA